MQRELFLSEVNDRETIMVTEANDDKYCLQNRMEKFPLVRFNCYFSNQPVVAITYQ